MNLSNNAIFALFDFWGIFEFFLGDHSISPFISKMDEVDV